jgi:hypothetical protein
MTPEAAAVLNAAEAFYASPDDPATRTRLDESVRALQERKARAAGTPTQEESDRPWAEVVVGDDILSAKTGKFYEVTYSVADLSTGKIKVGIKGNSKPILRNPQDMIRVKRGVLGDASDLLELLWSGQNKREDIDLVEAAPVEDD